MTFKWFLFHSHGLDNIIDSVDDVLVGPFISCNEAEAIGVGKSDDLCFFKRVSKLVFKPLRDSRMGLKTVRKAMGLRGSSWKTPLLKLNSSDVEELVLTID